MISSPPRVSDDFELLQAWRDGDERAGNTLFRRHFRSLFRFFSTKIDGPVDDLVQETITRAIKSFPKLRGSSQAEAERWLFGIARNVHMQAVTKQVGIRLRQDVASELAKYLQRTCEAVWYRPDIVTALSELPLGQLEVLRLMLEGLTIREIAQRLDLPGQTRIDLSQAQPWHPADPPPAAANSIAAGLATLAAALTAALPADRTGLSFGAFLPPAVPAAALPRPLQSGGAYA